MALQPIPGFLYLQRPKGPEATATLAECDIEEVPSSPLSDDATSPSAGNLQELRAPAPADIARLLHVWLEALDGRRPLKSLRSGRFHPKIVESIPAQFNGFARIAGRPGQKPAPVKASVSVRSLHLQPGQTHRVRFCASVVFRGRVRAVAGTTARVRMKNGSPRTTFWRLETLQLI